MKRNLSLAALGAALSLASAAHAQDPAGSGGDLAREVRIADIDLGKPGDVAVLKRRLHTASVELCLQATDELVMGEQQAAFSRCVAQASDAALRDASLVIARSAATPAHSFALR